jgi:hypothetical protein
MPPLNESRYLDDLAKPRSDAWKRGPRISLDDMISRTGFERVDLHAEARGGGSPSGARQDSKAVQSGKPKQSTKEPLRMWFGKHRGELVVDVMESDPGWIAWAKRDVTGFAAKLAAAGLDDDDGMGGDPFDDDLYDRRDIDDTWVPNR